MRYDSPKAAKLKLIQPLLERMYGKRDRKRKHPERGLDVLVRAMLSQNTTWANASRGYAMLRRRFPTWAKVLQAPVDEVQRQIAICGLARMRARRIHAMLERIERETGRLSIEFLRKRSATDAIDYLLSFHGVGPKTAAIVALFSLDHPVLPVDNGVLRVVRRLKLVRPIARDAEAERILSPLIEPGRHHAMHLLLYDHAKERCRPRNPKCGECLLLEHCPFGKRQMKHKPPESTFVPVGSPRRKSALAGYISAGVKKQTSGDPEISRHSTVRG